MLVVKKWYDVTEWMYHLAYFGHYKYGRLILRVPMVE